LLLSPNVPCQLVRSRGTRAALGHLVRQVAQRLALVGIAGAAQRLSRLSLAIGQWFVGGGGGIRRLLQSTAELLLGRIGELVGLLTKVRQLVPCGGKIAALDGVRGGLASRNPADGLGQAVQRRALGLLLLDAGAEVRVRRLNGLRIGKGQFGQCGCGPVQGRCTRGSQVTTNCDGLRDQQAWPC
jgi:hypothetical protein